MKAGNRFGNILAIIAVSVLMPLEANAQCPTLSGTRWPAGASVKWDLSNLPSQFHQAATAALTKANEFAAVAKTGVKFSGTAPDTYKVTFVQNTSINGPGQNERIASGGTIVAEIRINPESRFSDGTKVLDPNFTDYDEAVVLVFFHELLHTFGLQNVEFADPNSQFGGSVMNSPINARNNSNSWVAWNATNCDTQVVDNNYEDRADDEEEGGGGNGSCDPDTGPCECDPAIEVCQAPGSPIVVPVTNAQALKLTSAEEGVLFDLNADGTPELTAWTAADSHLAFLAIDRDGDGFITSGSELFGDHTVLGKGNGFAALAALAGNPGGSVTVEHPFFAKLLLWEDGNHNGVSEPNELRPASDLLGSIGLGYTKHNRKDGHGNLFRYRGWATIKGPKSFGKMTAGEIRQRSIHIYDVFFVRQ
jgi:hypothetical protein